jgi:hypothetical protein
MQCLRHMQAGNMDVIEVREPVQRRYNEQLQRRLQSTVWNSGGCANWYLNEHGRNTTIWPGSTWPFRRRLRRFEPADYELRRRALASDSNASARALLS